MSFEELTTMHTTHLPVQTESGTNISRRDVLQQGGLAALGLCLFPSGLPSLLAQPARESEKTSGSILFFTKCSGFEHGPVKRKGNAPCHAGEALLDLGKKHRFEVLETKDGRVFDSKELDDFDVLLFYTSGDLTKPGRDKQPPMSVKGKKRLLEVIAAGKGFIGAHSATDTFHTPGKRDENQETLDPYIAMIGGEFISHGPQQKATMRVVSPNFPGCGGLGDSFVLHEEWYALKNFAKDLHVILVNETKGMKSWQYQRPPFPATWARLHGKGRVFHTSMGHREDVWTHPTFQQILVGGIDWALRRVDADVTPNIAKVTPGASQIPKRKK